MTTTEFIQQYRESDPRDLAFLSRRYPDVDMSFALCQIQGWQTARRKLPSWAACDGVVYPPHLSMEQCSSEPTAQYKRELAQQWLDKLDATHHNSQPSTLNSQLSTLNPQLSTMSDLTGGFGVDFSFTSRQFDRAVYVERNPQLCRVVEANLPRLGVNNAKVVCAEAEDYLATLSPQTMLFLDPARRDAHGAKTVMLADCAPNVVQLLPRLMAKARFVMLKLSPMLDWHKAVDDLQGTVREVHIVSVGGECKELLLVLSAEVEQSLSVCCINLPNPPFCYVPSAQNQQTAIVAKSLLAASNAPLYLYEPNASIMKAGCFAELSRAFDVSAISPNSHLFLSADAVDGFPGRAFVVDKLTTMNRRELRQALSDIAKANIATRNFPLSVAELRKRLKLKDGGNIYIFATTTDEGEHILLITHKM